MIIEKATYFIHVHKSSIINSALKVQSKTVFVFANTLGFSVLLIFYYFFTYFNTPISNKIPKPTKTPTKPKIPKHQEHSKDPIKKIKTSKRTERL